MCSSDLKYNPWVNVYSPPYTLEPIDTAEVDEVDDENPATYLAEAEVYTTLKEEKLHLGPLVYEQQVSFNNLIESYADICAQSQTQIGRTNVIKHRIITGDALPIAQSAY